MSFAMCNYGRHLRLGYFSTGHLSSCTSAVAKRTHNTLHSAPNLPQNQPGTERMMPPSFRVVPEDGSSGATDAPIINYSVPLQKGQIRLVKFSLKGDSKGDDWTLSYQVQPPQPLSRDVKYFSVSYKWPTHDPPPHFRGYWLDTSHGPLAAVYFYLRSIESPSERSALFWIDQFSINQDSHCSNKEKEIQVRQMGDIYRNAEKTLIFLGIPQCPRNHREDTFAQAFDALKDVSHPVYKLPYNTTLSALAAILSAPWFERTWVVQEAVLSERAIIICGMTRAHQMDLFDFGRRMVAFERPHEQRFNHVYTVLQKFRQYDEDSWRNRGSRIGAIFRIREHHEEKNHRLPDMRSLMWQCRAFNTSDKRDKAYALMGLCEDTFDVTIDYQRSVKDTHRHIAVQFLSSPSSPSSNRFSALSSINADHPIRSPSWVSDWTRSVKYNDIWANHEPSKSNFYAGGGGSIEPGLHFPTDARHKLRVKGKVCARVKATSKTGPTRMQGVLSTLPENYTVDDVRKLLRDYWPIRKWLRATEVMARTGSSMLRPGDARRKSWARTVCADVVVPAQGNGQHHRRNDSNVSSSDATSIGAGDSGGGATSLLTPDQLRDHECLADAFLRFNSACDNFTRGNSNGRASGRNTPSSSCSGNRNSRGIQGFSPDVEARIDAFMAAFYPSRGRRFFVTEDGWLGLGPARMQAGDVVFVPAGSPWPFVLGPVEGRSSGEEGGGGEGRGGKGERAKEREYVLVGYCYVDGIMRGEAMPKEGEGEEGLEWVTLL